MDPTLWENAFVLSNWIERKSFEHIVPMTKHYSNWHFNLTILIFLIDISFSPFFGEELYFDIPRVFRFLSIYLYERERTVNTIRNRPLGKVIICRNYLCRFSSEEAWFPLVPIYHNSEIQGRVNLSVEPRYIFGSNCLRINVKWVSNKQM